ncbi:hypothetical protein GOV09_00170 [Candidatus Woesearchaeota archaeon]|nr:hypothetical protein [Candidatus Woesearchaeota archaeon]
MLKKEEIEKIREELQNCQHPVFLFDDDADGLCSFLLFYRFVKEGKGIAVKTHPTVDEKFVNPVLNYEPDKVFILDVAVLKQEFVDKVKRPIIWIDHHTVGDIQNVQYYNPRKHDPHAIYPTSDMCYDVVQQDLWIAMVGAVGDWHLPPFKDEFCKQYPDLLDASVKRPEDALFNSKLGELIKVFNFILKGPTKDVMKCVKVLTRVQSPYEILNQETEQGRFIYKRFEKINKGYEEVKNDVKVDEKDNILIYIYPEAKMSFTSELSNEMLYKHPDKIIIIGRDKGGQIRMSLRSSKIIIPPILDKALAGLEGYGGGHEHACGANVRKDQFEEFIARLRKEIV